MMTTCNWKKSGNSQQQRWGIEKLNGFRKKTKAEVVVTRIVGSEYGISGIAVNTKEVGISPIDATTKVLFDRTRIVGKKSTALKQANTYRTNIRKFVC